MSFSLSVLLLLSFGVGRLAAKGPSADLVVGNTAISPDGFVRTAVLAGSSKSSLSFPGPLISASKGDTFNINVINQLSDATMLTSTSIHWHGIFQRRSSWADGVVGVSQCPITPNQSFTYQFSSPSQAGTFWYHSHYSTQYCDGLRGPLVIYDAADPHRFKYDIDDETTIITLADWYHKTAHTVFTQGTVPKPDAILINGKGRYIGGPATTPLSVITVLPNKRYRFRLISMSCDPNYLFSIDGHDMTVIEADGNNVQPLLVDSIQIFAGQRYSFILDTTDKAVSNYWIRAQPSGVDPGLTTGGLNSAILRYAGAPKDDPTSTIPSTSNLLLETNLHPLEKSGAPGKPRPGAADVNLNLVTGFNVTARRFTMNGASYDPPSVPVLLQILNGASPQDLLPSGDVYVLPHDKVIELSIPGGSIGSPHPFHLHGHAFDVVRSAGSSVYNYVDPVKRDVVSVGGLGDNVTIRFQTDNAGPWILHCHIDWHLEAGLAVVFTENVPTIASSTQPEPWHDLCPIFQAAPTQTFT